MPIVTTRPCDHQLVATLTQQGIAPVLARLYAARDVRTLEDTQSRLPALLPFASLRGIAHMAAELADGIEAGARFLIVGDYDADGATATAVGVAGLRMLGANVDFLVPNRAIHGYGLSPAIVEEAAQLEPDAIITVDNGIAAHAGINTANELGIPVYVTDHHLPGDTLPEAAGIVNPNQPECAFPSKNLAGVGVMFYVLIALRAELKNRGAFETSPAPDLRVLLDRVALGTVADVVKLDTNNRILVNQGLQRIRAGLASPGIQALMQVAGRRCEKATAFDLGFMLGPRLNAAGRLEDMRLGIECLLAPTLETALPLAQQLHDLNLSRRDIESGMKEQALALLDSVDCTGKHGIAVTHPDWHAGVVGILASRLKEKYHRPVFAFAPGNPEQDNGELKGSGRSIAALHLRDALDWIDRQHPGLILKFGGHAMAAGLSIKAENFLLFQSAFEKLALEWLSPADLDEIMLTDGELTPEELTPELAQSIDNAVWGQGFPAPLFEGKFNLISQRIVAEKHLKLEVSLGNTRFNAMAFFHTDPLPEHFSGVYAPMLNEYNGNVSVQLKLHYWQQKTP